MQDLYYFTFLMIDNLYNLGINFFKLRRDVLSIIFNDHQQTFVLSNILSFVSLVLVIGGSIVLTLTYVAWRKFKGMKSTKERKNSKANH